MTGQPLLRPARSTSLPSRLHPSTATFYDKLSDLSSLCSPGTASRADGFPTVFAALSKIYSIVEKLLRSPTNHQTISRLLRSSSHINRVLDGYVRLLDGCSAARDIISITKQRSQEVASAIRRLGTDARVACSVDAYVNCRKKAKTSVDTTSKLLKQKCHEEVVQLPNVMRLLESVEEVSDVVLCSLLEFLYPISSFAPTTRRRWTRFTPSIFRRKTVPEDVGNELREVDKSMRELQRQLRAKKGIKVEVEEIAQRQLNELESKLEMLEMGVEGMFKGLIKNRVSLLNMLSS